MNLKIQNGPDEETPLLGGNQVSDVRRISESDSEGATLAGPSNQGSRTASIEGKPAEVVKKTPLPLAQFYLILFLQLAEPLTAQVISPVSSVPGYRFVSGRTLNDPSLPSLRPRSA